MTVASLVSSPPAMLDQRLKLQEPAAEVQATEATSQSVLESLTKKKMMTEKELREFAAVTKVMQLDSIIGAAENGLVLQQRQYFMYDTHKYPVKRLNSYWNTATHKWDTAETYEYVWDEDGYCLEQSAYSEPQARDTSSSTMTATSVSCRFSPITKTACGFPSSAATIHTTTPATSPKR